MRSLQLLLTVASVAWLVACGDETVSSAGDASTDALSTRDRIGPQEAATTDGVGSDGSADSGGTEDEGPPRDAGPALVDAGIFASCETGPCGYEQFCVNHVPFMDASPTASCYVIPAVCEPDPTCACIRTNAGSCPCKEHEGRFVLNCPIGPPPSH